MVDTRRRSPFEGDGELLASAGRKRLAFRETSFLTQLTLRADPRIPQLIERIGEIAGVPLPTLANTAGGSPSLAALWLGPDEWLLVAEEPIDERLAALQAAARHHGVTIVDVSAARTSIELSGVHARPLLEAACTIDLHPRSFSVRSCVQTLVRRTNVILWQISDEPAYRLLVRPSLARSLAKALLDELPGVEPEPS